MPLSRSTTMTRATPREIERFKMRTRNLSFQVEKTVPGVFLLQGCLGGILGGLVYTAEICLTVPRFEFVDAVWIAAYLVIAGSVAGFCKSIIMWVPYILTKVQIHPAARVLITSIGSGLVALLLALKFGYGFERPNDTAKWVLALIAGGLPTAILVGSHVKPWELFTFGSIAVGDSRTGRRVGSKSISATLATLPLRFLSLSALALLILACASEYNPNDGLLSIAVGFFVPFVYLFYSAYVTFKSPHRIVLLVICIVLNLPVGLIAYYAYRINRGSYLFTEALPYVCGIGSAFLIAWALFLVARLTAPTQKIIRETASHLDHHCLGSRFMEWQEHHA
jgi:hypothetical protein